MGGLAAMLANKYTSVKFVFSIKINVNLVYIVGYINILTIPVNWINKV